MPVSCYALYMLCTYPPLPWALQVLFKELDRLCNGEGREGGEEGSAQGGEWEGGEEDSVEQRVSMRGANSSRR